MVSRPGVPFAAALALTAIVAIPPASAQDCPPDGAIRYLCNLPSVEDLVPIPGTKLLLAGQIAPGGFFLIDTRTATARLVAPDFTSAAAAPYSACPGAPDPLKFASHGITLRDRRDGPDELYVVNHAGRESIEVFDVDVAGAAPRVSWKGCMLVPDSVSANGITHLPGGAVAVTSFGIRGDPGSFARMLEGKPAGMVVEWHPGTGWSRLPATEFVGDNGIAASADGNTLFVASWGDRTIRVVPRPGSKATPRSIALGDLHADNIHLGLDGKLIAAGQVGDAKVILDCARSREPICPMPYRVVEIDPVSGAVRIVFDAPGTPRFGGASVAAVVDGTVWIGTFRGTRVARVVAK